MDSQVGLVNNLIAALRDETKEDDFADFSVKLYEEKENKKAKQLYSLYDRSNSLLAFDTKSRHKISRPVTSLAQSSLFTGAVHEPRMYTEIKKEIASCNRIDMLVSFIKWSGLRLFIEDLRRFTQNGGKLRVITTSYMGATEVKAVTELSRLSNTEIKFSYNTKSTRLHAKAYVFYRNTGYTTAYVGSSNLSNAAMSSGLEWNVKITRQDLPETLDKIAATFESYWESNEFQVYTVADELKLIRALKAEKYMGGNDNNIYTLDVNPYPYQQEILDRLEAERGVRGCYRNLLVSATGTGKTVISAFDYKRFCSAHLGRANRLLFVAHREEILRQSLATFRAVLQDANFGELFVGNSKPETLDYLFVSVQTFNSQDFPSRTTPDFYDFIILDEIHHGPASSYQVLLKFYQPQILLGLTATPERMDGQSILPYFNGRIGAEIRLPEAIERKLLSPFQYFGVTDVADLRDIKWRAGGYDRRELSNLYTIDEKVARKRADQIVSSVLKYVADMDKVKGLGFCVSVEHADFMSSHFNQCGISSVSLSGNSSKEERESAPVKLKKGDIRFIFVVDIYNEGVDIPEVNTILFLRPTESLTIFLQQLGRGLRLADDKDCLTVLDFIGQAHKKYTFENKYAALLTDNTHSLKQEIEGGFFSAPKGCYIQLEKQAAKYILDSIRHAYDDFRGICGYIEDFAEDSGQELNLQNFLSYHALDPRRLYRTKNDNGQSFARMCVAAGVRKSFAKEPLEVQVKMNLVLQKLAVADSARWIRFLLDLLPRLNNVNFVNLSALEQRMLQMFYVSIWGEYADDWHDDKVLDRMYALADSEEMLAEIQELLKYRLETIDLVAEPVRLDFDCPLDLHCTYTRDQILVALDFAKTSTVREGVKWLPEKKLDVFFVTLNKAEKEYSPTTMYNDYSLSEWLFHWQSQSTTSLKSPTGQRYIHHREQGSKVLLFVREYQTDSLSGGRAAYTFLGVANHLRHEGEKPMNIVWKLEKPIPAKFLRKTNKLAVG